MQTPPRRSRKADLEASDAGGGLKKKKESGVVVIIRNSVVNPPNRRPPGCPQFTRLKALARAGAVTLRHAVIRGCI